MSDPRYEFYRYRELEAAGIVSSRFDLHNKIHKHGFPKPLKDGATMQAAAFWRKSAVHAWLDRNIRRISAKAG